MRLRRMQHSGTHCVAFFGTRGRQGIRHPRSIYDRSSQLGPKKIVNALYVLQIQGRKKNKCMISHIKGLGVRFNNEFNTLGES
jgi:hypothetical protein